MCNDIEISWVRYAEDFANNPTEFGFNDGVDAAYLKRVLEEGGIPLGTQHFSRGLEKSVLAWRQVVKQIPISQRAI